MTIKPFRTRDPIGAAQHRSPVKGKRDMIVSVPIYGTVWHDTSRRYPVRGKRERERAARRASPSLPGGA